MAKNKIRRFAEMKTFNCVFEPTMEDVKTGDYLFKEKWNEMYFRNNNPLVLELGCGKGEYTLGLGKKYTKKNFLGVDIKGSRMWCGAKVVEEEKLPNIAFLRTRIEFIDLFFGTNEVDEIWLTFSDPQPKKENKRLSSPVFIDKYKKFLKKDGVIHLKTDSDLLYEYTLEVCKEQKFKILEQTDDVYGKYIHSNILPEKKELLQIKTFYEQIFSNKGFTIKYLSFKPS